MQDLWLFTVFLSLDIMLLILWGYLKFNINKSYSTIVTLTMTIGKSIHIILSFFLASFKLLAYCSLFIEHK